MIICINGTNNTYSRTTTWKSIKYTSTTKKYIGEYVIPLIPIRKTKEPIIDIYVLLVVITNTIHINQIWK